MKAIYIILITLLVIILIAIPFILKYSKTVAKLRSTAINDVRQEYIIQDANKRIAGYEWFYAQYNEIEATRIKAKLAEGTPEELGIKQVLASMIAEYNAKASSILTVGQWRAPNLPSYINY